MHRIERTLLSCCLCNVVCWSMWESSCLDWSSMAIGTFCLTRWSGVVPPLHRTCPKTRRHVFRLMCSVLVGRQSFTILLAGCSGGFFLFNSAAYYRVQILSRKLSAHPSYPTSHFAWWHRDCNREGEALGGRGGGRNTARTCQAKFFTFGPQTTTVLDSCWHIARVASFFFICFNVTCYEKNVF